MFMVIRENKKEEDIFMKRKNKQMIGTALAVTMILGSLSGCVPQKTSSPAPETTAQAESKEGESDKPLMNAHVR